MDGIDRNANRPSDVDYFEVTGADEFVHRAPGNAEGPTGVLDRQEEDEIAGVAGVRRLGGNVVRNRWRNRRATGGLRAGPHRGHVVESPELRRVRTSVAAWHLGFCTSELTSRRSWGFVMVRLETRTHNRVIRAGNPKAPDAVTLDGTREYWRARQSTPWTANCPRDFFSRVCRSPAGAPPCASRTFSAGEQAQSRSSRPSAQTPCGRLWTAPNQCVQFRTASHHYLLLFDPQASNKPPTQSRPT